MAALHLRAQGLERAELKLLDGAFRFLQAAGDFADGALLDEALADNLSLSGGKVVDESEEARVVVDGFQIGGGRVWMRFGVLRIVRGRVLARGALVQIGEGVGGYAEEPRCERSAAPFVVGEIGESFVKDFRGEVLGGGAVANAADEKIVDTLEMKLVEGFEFCGVALCGFYKQTLVGAWRRRLLCRTSDSYHGSAYSNWREQQKVTRARFFEGKELRRRDWVSRILRDDFALWPICLPGLARRLPRAAHGYTLFGGGTLAHTGLEGFRPAFLS
jgi:hypothetical protein